MNMFNRNSIAFSGRFKSSYWKAYRWGLALAGLLLIALATGCVERTGSYAVYPSHAPHHSNTRGHAVGHKGHAVTHPRPAAIPVARKTDTTHHGVGRHAAAPAAMNGPRSHGASPGSKAGSTAGSTHQKPRADQPSNHRADRRAHSSQIGRFQKNTLRTTGSAAGKSTEANGGTSLRQPSSRQPMRPTVVRPTTRPSNSAPDGNRSSSATPSKRERQSEHPSTGVRSDEQSQSVTGSTPSNVKKGATSGNNGQGTQSQGSRGKKR